MAACPPSPPPPPPPPPGQQGWGPTSGQAPRGSRPGSQGSLQHGPPPRPLTGWRGRTNLPAICSAAGLPVEAGPEDTRRTCSPGEVPLALAGKKNTRLRSVGVVRGTSEPRLRNDGCPGDRTQVSCVQLWPLDLPSFQGTTGPRKPGSWGAGLLGPIKPDSASDPS